MLLQSTHVIQIAKIHWNCNSLRIYELVQHLKFFIVLLCFLCAFESYHTVAGRVGMDGWSQLHDQPLAFGVQGQSSTCDVFCGDGQLSFSFIWFVNSCVTCCGFGLDFFRLGLHR